MEHALGAAYELRELVGQGGFGRVYDAHDRRLDRRVAIKVIRPDLAGATAFLDRFRREGVALARLRHPAVVPIYLIGRHWSLSRLMSVVVAACFVLHPAVHGANMYEFHSLMPAAPQRRAPR